jgi:hypothetical protein
MVEHRNIYQRISEVQRAVGYVQKESKKVNNQYTFVSHDAVVAALRGPMIDNGVVYTVSVIEHARDGNTTEATIEVAFINIDNPEDRFCVRGFGYGVDQQDKGPGKAVSYAVKYVLLKTFALETGDDPERDSIDAQPNVSASKAQSTQAKPAAQTKSSGDTGWQAIGSALAIIYPAHERQERFAILREYAPWVDRGGSKKEIDELAAHCEAIATPIGALREMFMGQNSGASDETIEKNLTQWLAEKLDVAGRKSILDGCPKQLQEWVDELRAERTI